MITRNAQAQCFGKPHYAEKEAKASCPVSKALSGVDISLHAKLK